MSTEIHSWSDPGQWALCKLHSKALDLRQMMTEFAQNFSWETSLVMFSSFPTLWPQDTALFLFLNVKEENKPYSCFISGIYTELSFADKLHLHIPGSKNLCLEFTKKAFQQCKLPIPLLKQYETHGFQWQGGSYTRTPKQMGSSAGIAFTLPERPHHKHTENKFCFSSVS